MVIDAGCDYLPSPLDVNEGKLTVMNPDNKEETEDFEVSSESPL